jgi:hypothetical protein
VHTLRNFLRPKVIISGLIAAFIVATGILTGPSSAQATTCPGHDNDTNAVIRCGFNTLSEFGTAFAKNSAELQTIYSHFTAPNAFNVNTFKSSGVHVTMYKATGETKLDDGTVVATNTNSLGRENHGANRKPISIGNKTYYYSPIKDSFASSSLDGYAVINDDHSMALAIMMACGNPGWGTSPGYKCQMLKQTKVNDTTYKYVATPFTKNGATVSKIVYDFGDGKSTTVTTNFGQEVTHVYAPGKYTARSTVYFMVNGKEKSDTRQECTKPVDVPQPPKPVFYCTQLLAKQVTGSRTKFTFTATGHVENGAVLQSGTFKFDDGKTATANAVGNTVTTTYEYTKVGNHTTTVDLTFNVGKDINDAKCKVVTTTTSETCKDTPTKPECQTCENTSTKPGCETCANTPSLPECQPPKKDCATNPEMAECKEIPSTGPEEVVGLGSLTGAGMYYLASRRNWLDKIFKR